MLAFAPPVFGTGRWMECPPAAELTWEKRRVLVFWSHDRTVTLKGTKVVGHSQSDERTGTGVSGIRHGVAIEAAEIDDARILDSP